MKEQAVIAIVGIVAILAIFGSIFMWMSMSNEGLKHVDVSIQNPETVKLQMGYTFVILIIGGIVGSCIIGAKVYESL